MNVIQPGHATNFLRHSLRANALFSTLSGLVFAVASAPVAAILGDVAPLLVFGVGLQLLLFAAALVWLASRSEISVPLTIAVIAADLLWVLGTAVVVHADLFARQGEILALVLADVVLVLAILQSIGVRRMTTLRARSTT
jgi:hypothetical protein